MTDDYESLKHVIVWKAVSSRTFSGGMSGFPHTEYLFTDRVLITHLGDYLRDITDKNPGIEKITLTRLGTLENVWHEQFKPRPGTQSFTQTFRKILTLESFQ
jgi:hypothetical protein